MAYVELEVEIAVLDPIRVIQIHRHTNEAFAENWREMQTTLDVLENAPEGDSAATSGRLVVNVEAGTVERCVRLFLVDE